MQTDFAPPVPASETSALLSKARAVLDVEIEALEALKTQLNDDFSRAVGLILKSSGRVIVTGMGKSGLVGRKIAATLSSTGTPAYFLHPAEGSHGDLGLISPQDVVIAISNSGETTEILGILPTIKRFGMTLIALCGRADSTLVRQSDVWLNIAVPQEACPLGLAPTASTTATLALGDALAVVLLEQRRFSADDFAVFHPSGALGKRLLTTVADLMHTGEQLPLVLESTPFLEALMVMTTKKLGLAIVVNAAGNTVGLMTDGDIRRAITRYEDVRAIGLAEVMTPNPQFIEPEALAVTALRLMETRKITALLVQGSQGQPHGVLHMHDILNAGIH